MKVKEIESLANPYARKLLSLLTAKGIKKEGLILVAGRKIVPEVLRHSSVENIIFTEGQSELLNDLQMANDLRGLKVSKDIFAELDSLGSHFPLLVVPLPKIDDFIQPKKGLNVFLALSDPANLGAALRSLAAFKVDQVVLLTECANAFLPKVTKAASGANLKMSLTKGPSLSDLQVENPVALDLRGTEVRDFQWPSTTCLILGEEGQGLPENLKEKSHLLRIEMSEQVESLSAPIALSIACYLAHSQLKSGVE